MVLMVHKMKYLLSLVLVLITTSPALGCDIVCQLKKELSTLEKQKDPAKHEAAGLRVTYGVSRKWCSARGGVIIKNKNKSFCSYFPM